MVVVTLDDSFDITMISLVKFLPCVIFFFCFLYLFNFPFNFDMYKLKFLYIIILWLYDYAVPYWASIAYRLISNGIQ